MKTVPVRYQNISVYDKFREREFMKKCNKEKLYEEFIRNTYIFSVGLWNFQIFFKSEGQTFVYACSKFHEREKTMTLSLKDRDAKELIQKR